MTREAMKQALEAWQTHVYGSDIHRKAMLMAMTALRQALEQADEPVVGTKTWFDGEKVVTQELKHSDVYMQPSFTTGHCKEHAKPGGCQLHNLHCGYPQCDRKPVACGYDETTGNCTKNPCCYTHPQPKREWVGLTDEERMDALASAKHDTVVLFGFARAIEQVLKEKNT